LATNLRIVINVARHLPARDLARTYGYSRGYVARLCRQNIVRGRKLGSLWYVDVESFAAFVLRQTHDPTLSAAATKEISTHTV
jgi:hypothetical protein